MTAAPPPSSPLVFFRLRWRGDVSLQQLFWWDTLAVATFANALIAVLGLMLLTQKVHGGIWLGLHVLLLPYNLFLLIAVWRMAGSAPLIRVGAMVWFVLVTLI